MFGSLFRLGLLTTLVGGSTVALVGSDRLKSLYESGKDTVLTAIDEVQGMESKLKEIRREIDGLDHESRELKEQAVRRRVESEQLRGEIDERQAALDKRKRVLEQVAEMLKENRDTIVIGRTVFSRSEVEQDAAEKLALYDLQTETLRSLRETLATKEKAQAIAEENVGRAAALRVDLASRVGLLEARLQKYRAKQAFAATVDDISDTADLDSDLAHARELMKEFEKDLEVKDRVLDEKLKGGTDQPRQGIDYDALAADHVDLLQRIDRSLGRASDAKGTIGIVAPDAAVAASANR